MFQHEPQHINRHANPEPEEGSVFLDWVEDNLVWPLIFLFLILLGLYLWASA